MTSGDGHGGGRGFLRDMAAQSARAQEFDRRLRWSRLSKRLRDLDVAGHAAEVSSEDVIDLREGPDPVGLEPTTTSAAPEVPVPHPRGSGPDR